MKKNKKPNFVEKLVQPSIHLYPIQLKAKAIMRTSKLTTEDVETLREVYKYTFDHMDKVTERDKKTLLNLRETILEFMQYRKDIENERK